MFKIYKYSTQYIPLMSCGCETNLSPKFLCIENTSKYFGLECLQPGLAGTFGRDGS